MMRTGLACCVVAGACGAVAGAPPQRAFEARLLIDWGAQEGSLTSTQLLVVTRRAAGGSLRLLERVQR